MDTVTTLLTIAGGSLGLVVTYMAWRWRLLWREEVLDWSFEVIAVLQKIHLYCIFSEGKNEAALAGIDLPELAAESSVLVEKGRVFFKNKHQRSHGKHKWPAYRGLRPKILDPIIVAHQVALALPKASGNELRKLRIISEDCVKEFVSLAQLESGRKGTASKHTDTAGIGIQLSALLQKIETDARYMKNTGGDRDSASAQPDLR